MSRQSHGHLAISVIEAGQGPTRRAGRGAATSRTGCPCIQLTGSPVRLHRSPYIILECGSEFRRSLSYSWLAGLGSQ